MGISKTIWPYLYFILYFKCVMTECCSESVCVCVYTVLCALSNGVSLSVSLLSQVIFILDELQVLSQRFKAGPHCRLQSPAQLHDVVYSRRTAVRGVHLVALFHAWHHVFQRLWQDRETFKGGLVQFVQLNLLRFKKLRKKERKKKHHHHHQY